MCDTLRDVALELAWHVRHRINDAGPDNFNAAVANGTVTFDELAWVASDAANALMEIKEKSVLARTVPEPVVAAKVTSRL
jgi:hypothetical protein